MDLLRHPKKSAHRQRILVAVQTLFSATRLKYWLTLSCRRRYTLQTFYVADSGSADNLLSPDSPVHQSVSPNNIHRIQQRCHFVCTDNRDNEQFFKSNYCLKRRVVHFYCKYVLREISFDLGLVKSRKVPHIWLRFTLGFDIGPFFSIRFQLRFRPKYVVVNGIFYLLNAKS